MLILFRVVSELWTQALEFVHECVETPEVHGYQHPRFYLKEACSTFIFILLAEIAAILLLFFLIPAGTIITTYKDVTAAEALINNPDCLPARWSDITAYGSQGLILPGKFPPGVIHIMGPILGKDLAEEIPNLNCTAPSGPALVANYQNYNGWEVILGQAKNICQGSRFFITQTQGDLRMNCKQAYGHLKEVFYHLPRTTSKPEEEPSFFALECSVLNHTTLLNLVNFNSTFRWPARPDRPPIQLKVTVLCSGLPTVAALLGQKTVDDAVHAAMDSTRGYCLSPDPRNVSCMATILKRSLALWGPEPEYVLLEIGGIDTVDAPLYNVNLTGTIDNGTGEALYVQDSRFSEYWAAGQRLDMNLSIFNQLGQEILLDPTKSLYFADFQYLARSCPGRYTPLQQDLDQFNDAVENLQQTAMDYANSRPFRFSCQLREPPSLIERCRAIWPPASVLHTLVMTYFIRITYRGVIAARNQLQPRRRANDLEVGAGGPPATSVVPDNGVHPFSYGSPETDCAPSRGVPPQEHMQGRRPSLVSSALHAWR